MPIQDMFLILFFAGLPKRLLPPCFSHSHLQPQELTNLRFLRVSKSIDKIGNGYNVNGVAVSFDNVVIFVNFVGF